MRKSPRMVAGYHRKNGVPPFFGRQMRQSAQSTFDAFHISSLIGRTVALEDCHARFRKLISKVFQGIGIGKLSAVADAANMVNDAIERNTRAVQKLIALGILAIRAYVSHEVLLFDLRRLDSAEPFTLADVPRNFVTA